VTHPIANTKVHLKDEKGNIVEAMFTNDFGTFVFTKTPSCQNFEIELAENNPKLAGVKVIITDRNGKEISSTTCTSEGQFNFEFLKQDELKLQTMEVEETTLRLDMKGRLFKNTAGNALSIPAALSFQKFLSLTSIQLQPPRMVCNGLFWQMPMAWLSKNSSPE
jgi:ethanolamine utilization protein EutQ (cupin superfamily)